jgi:3-oxoacyl-[acyl-carrier-protein] synthase III
MRQVVVVGAWLHRYGVFPEKHAIELGTVAVQRALNDAGCLWTDIDAVYCGTVHLGMSAGHNICRHMEKTGL